MPVQTRSMTKPKTESKTQDCIVLMRKILRNTIGPKASYWYYTSYMDTFMDAYYAWEEIALEKNVSPINRYKIMRDFVLFQYHHKNI